MCGKILIGVDGGGTKTALAAADAATGKILAEAVVGSINYNFIGVRAAADALLEGIRRLGTDTAQIAAIAVGDPSVDDFSPVSATAEFVRLVREALPGCPSVTVKSDVFMALYGMTGEKSGVLIVSGTGSMGLARAESGRLYVAGGWGRLTGDEGSGYDIGLNGIRAALRCADGVGAPTLLSEKMLRFYGVENARQMIGVFYGDTPPDIAGFSRVVDEAAREGDTVARTILRDAAGQLAGYALSLIRQLEKTSAGDGAADGDITVGVYGSVLCRNETVRGRFEALLRAAYPGIAVTEPTVRPERAAIRYLQNHPETEGTQEKPAEKGR